MHSASSCVFFVVTIVVAVTLGAAWCLPSLRICILLKSSLSSIGELLDMISLLVEPTNYGCFCFLYSYLLLGPAHFLAINRVAVVVVANILQ